MHILITSVIDLQQTPYSRLHHFIDHLLSRGHRITVISIKDSWKHKGAAQNQELCNRIRMLYITDKEQGIVRQKLQAMLVAKRLLYEAGYCDVHLCYNSMILGYIVARALRKKGIHTVYDLADDLPEMIRTSPHIPKILRGLGGRVGGMFLNKCLAISKKVTYTAKEFESTFDIKRFNSELLPNGVDCSRFKGCSKKHKGIVAGYVGALREWVDLRPMLLAVKRLHQEGMEIRALVVGGEEGLPQYRAFAAEKGMEGLIEFTGNVPYNKVKDYIASMDICTVPFKKNRVTDSTNPLKLLEYLACEKAVVCSRLNEPRSMLGNAILYADSTDEWEAAIRRLAEDAKLRLKMGREGRKIVLSRYNWKDICRRMELLLEAAGKCGNKA